MTLNEIILSLERLQKLGKPKTVDNSRSNTNNDMKYSELPSDFFVPLGDQISNKWDNGYSILNTDKWKVPIARPPVCISNGSCKVCPSNTIGYPVSLQEWDNSRYVSENRVNKKWTKDQTSTKVEN